ncbi:cytochrome P450 [Sphingobium sp.]|uniref:cytochrome P450 n=1 Tax=Sphingobium sp. TaxID=1912891 RepID=UPI0028BEE7C1|nr:cytochrome P450 [Sphingobium sp.]
MADAPVLDIDLFTEESILDPYENYAAIRDAGPAVWLPRHQVYALGRYRDVRAALRDGKRFVSGEGVFFNAEANQHIRGTLLASDGDLHDKLRGIIAPPLYPAAVRALAEGLTEEAEALVARLVEGRSFDAVLDLAWHLPSTVVTRLVGLPEDGRERMREWGLATFDAIGPADKPRTLAAMPDNFEMHDFVASPDLPERLLPGSWSTRIFDAAKAGEITAQQCVSLLIDYVAPSLDTTVSAMSSAIWLFAQFSEQWDLLRARPALMSRAIAEVVRLESPIRTFSRFAAEDVEVDGVTIPAGACVAMLYASANRDERKWTNPERFDIEREGVNDHLGFGNGAHICAGMHLAQLEVTCVLRALASRVKRFHLGAPERLMSNILRGFHSLPIEVEI